MWSQPHSISSLPPWSSHTGNLYLCGFGCLLLPYFLLSRLTGPLCNIWGYQEAYQFLTKPTQLLQRLASIANLLEVKENCKIMKRKKFWSIIKGKHLEKLHLSTDPTGTLCTILCWRHYIRLKGENKTTLTLPSFVKETGCIRYWFTARIK